MIILVDNVNLSLVLLKQIHSDQNGFINIGRTYKDNLISFNKGIKKVLAITPTK